MIGIDGGVNGGIVVLDNTTKEIIYKQVMPVTSLQRKDFDIREIIIVLKKFITHKVIIEKAQPRYRDGSKQAFKTGFGYAVLQTAVIALNMEYEIVPAKEWQQYIFKTKKVEDTKKASLEFCKQQWPEESWMRTERCLKEHDGMTDAACIAYYGLVNKED